MQITETVTREAYVAPCIQCGSSDISISDYGYNAPNIGGGQCNACKHEVRSGCSCIVDMKTLISIWNAGNDPKLLIKEQQKIIENAQKRIDELQSVIDNRVSTDNDSVEKEA